MKETPTVLSPTEEMALPTVMIDQPEFFAALRRKRMAKVAFSILGVVIFMLLAGLLVGEFVRPGGARIGGDTVVLTVKVIPEDLSKMVVSVDGEVLSGNPLYLITPGSREDRKLVITAPGYEPLIERIRLDASVLRTFSVRPLETP